MKGSKPANTGGTWAPITRYAVVFAVGVVLAAVHWLGILIGGVLVGLLAPGTARGIIYGGVFGLFVWLVSLGILGWAGIYPTMEGIQLYGVSFGIPVLLGAVGGSAREFRPWISAFSPVSGRR